MRKALAIATIMLAAASTKVQAQTDLTAYADANGYIDVQALTCAALAGTWQGDADRLTTWYSGWYNGLAKKHAINIPRSREAEHEIRSAATNACAERANPVPKMEITEFGANGPGV